MLDFKPAIKMNADQKQKHVARKSMSDQNMAEEKMQLARLKLEHDDFHAAIDAVLKCNCNSLQIQRMKKKTKFASCKMG